MYISCIETRSGQHFSILRDLANTGNLVHNITELVSVRKGFTAGIDTARGDYIDSLEVTSLVDVLEKIQQKF